jgi:hypothetical protein
MTRTYSNGNSKDLSINDRGLLGIHNILYISISSLLCNYGRDCLSNGNGFVSNGSSVEEESSNLDPNPVMDSKRYKHGWGKLYAKIALGSIIKSSCLTD